MKDLVYRGSCEYLPNDTTPVISDAAKMMAKTATQYTPENPLYIVALGAITNVASAILLAPEAMINNTVIVWLGGHAHHISQTREFNMKQDFAAARVVFGCGGAVVQLPCAGVVDRFLTTEGELTAWLKGKNPIADYLCQNTICEAESYAKGKAWSRVIWDVTAVAWLLNDNGRFMASRIVKAPIPTDEGVYEFPKEDSPDLCYVHYVNRDALFTDLFVKLTGKGL